MTITKTIVLLVIIDVAIFFIDAANDRYQRRKRERNYREYKNKSQS